MFARYSLVLFTGRSQTSYRAPSHVLSRNLDGQLRSSQGARRLVRVKSLGQLVSIFVKKKKIILLFSCSFKIFYLLVCYLTTESLKRTTFYFRLFLLEGYGCEKSLVLKAVFRNRISRRIFGPKNKDGQF